MWYDEYIILENMAPLSRGQGVIRRGKHSLGSSPQKTNPSLDIKMDV